MNRDRGGRVLIAGSKLFLVYSGMGETGVGSGSASAEGIENANGHSPSSSGSGASSPFMTVGTLNTSGDMSKLATDTRLDRLGA